VYLHGIANTTVDCSGVGQLIVGVAQNVVITGGNYSDTETGVCAYSYNNLTIRGVTASRSNAGVLLGAGTNVSVYDSQFVHCRVAGVQWGATLNVTLVSNVFTGTGVLPGEGYLAGNLNESGNTVNGKPLGVLYATAEGSLDASVFGQLLISRSQNLELTGGTFSNLYYGIYLYKVENVTVRDAAFTDCTYGIAAYESNTVTFVDINTTGCDTGLFARWSDGSTVTGCRISDSTSYGISSETSDNVAVRSCHVDNATTGVFLYDGANMTLFDTTVNGGEIGVHLLGVENITAKWIVVTASSDIGIYCDQCYNYTVRGSTVTGSGTGISSYFGANGTLADNLLQTTDVGIRGEQDISLNIRNNSVLVNKYGIDLLQYSGNMTFNRVQTTGGVTGIRVAHSVNCVLRNNSVSGYTSIGVWLLVSENVSIHYNRISGNTLNAKDSGPTNMWDDGVAMGNYWDDYSGSGVYSIEGMAHSVDRYPALMENDPPVITTRPDDITMYDTDTGKNITWVVSDANPSSYVIYRNGTVVVSHIWDGSDIVVSLDGLSPGVYNFTLVVSDLGGLTASDTVFVTVLRSTTTTTTTTTITTTTSTTSTTGTTSTSTTETSSSTTGTTSPTGGEAPPALSPVVIVGVAIAVVLVVVAVFCVRRR